MKDTIRQTMRKTYAYWWVDGMADMAMGFFFLVLAGYNYCTLTIPLSSTARVLMAIGQPLVFLLCWFGYGRLVKWVKEHITYRRTGYVAYQPRKKKNRAQRAVVGAVLGITVSLMVTYIGPELLHLDPMVVVGCVMAAVTFYLGYWYGVKRLMGIALLEVGLGIWISTLPLEADMRSTLMMACMGAVWIISGVATFVVYLRKNTESEDQPHE